jgi:hypothetical protein
MKKVSKPVPKTQAAKAPANQPSAAKLKAKPATKPRKASVQTELLPIVERLAQAAERLAQAAERLAEATVPKPLPPRDEAPAEDFKTIAELAEAAKNDNE